MTRKLNKEKLVVASHNQGKVREIAELLKPFDVEIISSAELGLSEPIEDGDSFVANAQIKSHQSAKEAGLPALADDSGLVVHGLDGQPGIYSARWAGEDKDFNMAMERIHNELGDKERTAHFICVLSIAWPDGHEEHFEGRVDGKLVWPIRGGNGFGYDPMFIPDGFDETFGEMDPDLKHTISHRHAAFVKFVESCFDG